MVWVCLAKLMHSLLEYFRSEPLFGRKPGGIAIICLGYGWRGGIARNVGKRRV